MRGPKLLLMSLTMLFVFCAPTFAQSAPAASQYSARTCPDGIEEGQDNDQTNAGVGDGACASTENVGQGTGAVNDALGETASSPGASTSDETSPVSTASASAGAVSPEDAASETGNAEGGEAVEAGEGLASITELPETGGASPVLPVLGVLLLAAGLLARGIARR